MRTIVLPDGNRSVAAVIVLDGEFDRLGKEPRLYPWEHLSPKNILHAIVEQGVVGMGGSGVPTHLKYQVSGTDRIDVLVLNAIESEPYLSPDERLVLERTDELLEGLRIAEKVLNPRRVVIAVRGTERDVVHSLTDAVSRAGLEYRVVRMSGRYPQGDEKQIVRAVTGHDVPSGGSPRDVGVVVSNVGTVIAIYEAVVLQKPVVERVVTVSGRAIERPSNLKVRIGTPIAELIEECGGLVRDPAKIVVGGPMMGHAIRDLSTPVTKTTRGILALTAEEVGDAPQTSCIQCGRCVRACPMGLEPTLLYKLIDHGDIAEADASGLMDCSECGSCGYVCPAHIPLVEWLRNGKEQIVNLQQTGKGKT
jgi:electron transport complex protein RnfC